MPQYTVRQRDCLSSIAERYGLTWQRIWEHPNNAQFRNERESPNILYPGDVIFVPDRESRDESGSTSQRHRFRRRGTTKLKIRLLIHGIAAANQAYILEIGGSSYNGNTDVDGILEETIPTNARNGKLTLQTGEDERELLLDIGGLDPITEITGVQARLNNLGYDCGRVDGRIGPLTRAALSAFQETNELEITGEIDSATRDKLVELYGS